MPTKTPPNSRRCALLIIATCAGQTTSAQLLADSVADFSGIQGKANWVYLYSVGNYDVNALIPFAFSLRAARPKSATGTAKKAPANTGHPCGATNCPRP